jgi:predicted phage terminase large subunit-like protein
VCNAGSPRTNVVVLGTALHREAIVCKLQTTPGWRSKVFRSLQRWPERMDLWASWGDLLHDWADEAREAKAQAFYEANRGAMEAGAEVLWPGREPLHALMRLRATVGPAAFASEKQNDPVNPELCEWGAEYFDYPGFWFEDWPKDLTLRVLSLDPSKGKDSDLGDYTAYVRIGLDRDLVMYVEADLRRMTSEAIVDTGLDHVKAFKPDSFVIETNIFAELFVAMFQVAAARERLILPLAGWPNVVSKEVRIRRLGTYLAQRKFRFKARSAGTQLLVQQLRDFPQGDHDDGPDALEQGLRQLIELHNGRVRRAQEKRLQPW